LCFDVAIRVINKAILVFKVYLQFSLLICFVYCNKEKLALILAIELIDI